MVCLRRLLWEAKCFNELIIFMDCAKAKKDFDLMLGLKEKFNKYFSRNDYPLAREVKLALVEKAKEIEKSFFVSIDEARSILDAGLEDGKSNVLGPDALEGALGIRLDEKDIPPIPFASEELEQAKELNQFLVLRVNKTNDGKSLTLKEIERIHKAKNDGKELYKNAENWLEQWDLYHKETVQMGWALVGRSQLFSVEWGKDSAIMENLAGEIKNIYSEGNIPADVQQQLDYYEQVKDKIDQNELLSLEERGEIYSKMELLGRPVVEVVYDGLLYFQQNGEYLLNDNMIWTNSVLYQGRIMFVGGFDQEGIQLDYNNKFGVLGVGFCFSRS